MIAWLGYLGMILVVGAYLPQIIHLVRERCAAGLSVRAYECWTIGAVLLLSYAFALRDTVFIALQTYQVGAATLICFLGNKYRDRLCEDHQTKSR